VTIDDVVIGPLPPEVEPLAFLLGTWRGAGRGEYPTMDPFDYGEFATFDHVGDAFLLYRQRSWMMSDGAPLHFERGFLRPGSEPGTLELTLAHPLGLTEISEGRVHGGAIDLESRDVGRTGTGMGVASVVRRYRLEGDVLRYELDMKTDDTPLSRHLTGEWRRVAS
jgi:THAP4-like, heme-binding beta-barrel domain